MVMALYLLFTLSLSLSFGAAERNGDHLWDNPPWLSMLNTVRQAGFEVLTFISQATPSTMRRTNILDEFPLPIRVFGIREGKESWDQNGTYFLLLQNYVSTVPPDRILFLVFDLYDVVWLHCDRDLVSSFQRVGRPIVFGAEFFPYPLTRSLIIVAAKDLLTGNDR